LAQVNILTLLETLHLTHEHSTQHFI
jgi:hypothetical protein